MSASGLLARRAAALCRRLQGSARIKGIETNIAAKEDKWDASTTS